MPLTPQYSITCEVKSAPFFSKFSVRLLHALIMQLDILVSVFGTSCNSRTVPDVFLKLSYSEIYWLYNIIELVFSKRLMNSVQFYFPVKMFLILHEGNSSSMSYSVENHLSSDRLCSSVSSSLTYNSAI